jgi:sterol desaturase/sphingolipid hydroxylase (fatty acid hydroxylase superfamily)
VALLVVYDALFFVGHWTMHRLPWLYKHVHAVHHDQAGEHASTHDLNNSS